MTIKTTPQPKVSSRPAKATKRAGRGESGRVRPAKTARMEARLSEDAKALVQQAADLRGETLTEFVLAASREKAAETLREAQLIRLTADDQQRFAEALLTPPAPAKRLQDAAERYRQAMD